MYPTFLKVSSADHDFEKFPHFSELHLILALHGQVDADGQVQKIAGIRAWGASEARD